MMLPHGWATRRFDQIGELCSGSTPSSSRTEFWDGTTVWVTPTDLSRLNTPYLRDSAKHITEQGLRNCSARLLPPGSIVLSSRAPIGYVAIPTVPFCTNQGCKSIALHSSFHSEFVYYAVTAVVPRLKQIGEGTTFAEISKSSLAKAEVVLPIDKAEQAKIAKVLSTLDRVIEQTEALITKQQRIKTGLMQDLLTRGIDVHGNLRSEQTHEFKDSSLGRIPAGWEVKALSEIGWFTNGINKSKEDFGFGTLFVNIADVYPDHLDVHSLGRLNASDAEATRYGLNIGDILIDRSSVKLEGVGYPTVFEGHNEPVVFCGFIIRFRPRVDISSRFLCLQMRDDPFRTEVFKVATRSANVNVNQESLAELRIKIPTVDEQNRIVSFEAAIDREHQNLRTQLVKLASLKTALMQDLLTGKKRVNPLLEQAAKD